MSQGQDIGGTKLACGLCGILVGGLGIHRFILGDTTGGILRIVIAFGTCGMGGIIGLVEGIIYLTKTDQLRDAPGDWGVHYRYTYGVAGERFFREVKDHGRLVASSCPKCQRRFLPPSQYCEDCFVEMTEYEPVEGAGTVHSFTVLRTSLEETPLPEPLVAAFVKFDGIDGGLLAPLRGVKPDQAKIGMPVKLALETDQPTHSAADLGWVPA